MSGFSKTDPSSYEKKPGRLKIFFGYAAGTGKTFSMLEAAQEAKRKGTDLVIGYLEEHERPQTLQMAEGLERLPRKESSYHGMRLSEFDKDAAIERKPQVVLVDELAHTNAPGMVHAKRYQDVQEVLRSGIAVWTTLNVQHLESLCDIVASITGITVQERIPDDVFDLADQVELIDIEPEDLLVRLQEGKVYSPDQAKLAAAHFFTLENLKSLREIAVRRCADRFNRIMPALKSREHVLVCLSSSPSNAKIIRAAARMAQAFHARFSALYVHNEDTPVLGEEDQKRLEENMRLANRLGADLETGYGNDISEQIGEFARIAHVTKIVAGRSGRKSAFSHPFSLMEKLSESAPEAELYIIPDAGIMQKTGMGKIRHAFAKLPSLKEWLPVFANAALATLLAALFSALHLSEASIIAIYIFCVLISAIQCPNLLLCAGSAVLNMALFLYCFAAPRFSLHFWDGGYIITFLILLSTALLTGRLSQKRKAQVSLSRQAALRSGLLYEISQNLLAASSVEQIQELTARSAGELLRLDTVFYTNENGTLSEPCFYGDENVFLSSKERAVALWTLKNNKRAGAGTDTLSAASALYLAVRHSHHVYGVLGISLGKRRLSPDENSTVLSILDECALALENQNNELEKKKAYAQAEREKLKASLLRSIGHDLRTPLTAICGSADVLLSGTCAPEQQRKLLGTIHDDAFWLSQIVENLLSITRLEEGGLQIHQQPEVLDEVVE